jgi:single-strand selective monofunctional uracil DNA glycosylase
VLNYCPLVFMEEGGKNFTPDKLSKAEQAALFGACDVALRGVLDAQEPELLIGVGAFAEACLKRVAPVGTSVSRILHPSPASPKANRDWSGEVTRDLARLGLLD